MNFAAIPADFATLHFLRPWWLCALLALPLLPWWWRRRQHRRSVWRELVDPHLLPHLLATRGDRRERFAPWLAALASVLAVLALAGPSWRQIAQPLWQSRTPLVIALDLSSAALAADLPPSRLARARAKLATLLRERNGGQVGLVVFAGDAFTVAPLTDDAANVALFLDALQPDVMPIDGQRADRAIAWSMQLLRRTGATSGDIVLLTDHADAAARTAAAEAAAAGYRVSVLGLGSTTGAAYRRDNGDIASARLDSASLRALAADGNGRYQGLTDSDADLQTLGLLDPRSSGEAAGGNQHGRSWQDEGYWLLPPLLLLSLFAFRRRSGAVLALLLVAALPSGNARAADVWRRPDQAAHARLQQGNQAYRKGDYRAAVQQYEDLDSATAHYNRGNALAKAGQYPQAIAAYDEALRRQPRMDDALANKRAVEAAMKRRRSPDSSGQQDPQKSQGEGGQANPQPGQDSAQRSPSPPRQASPSSQSRPQSPQRDPQQQSSPKEASPPPAQPSDAKAQQEADRAQRERMQRALQRAKPSPEPQKPAQARVEETSEQRERRLANEAWLKRVPDDPGGLLRAKFRLEYERRTLQGRAEP